MTDRLRGAAGVQRRAKWLRLHPLCVHCLARRKVSEAKRVDHIVALVNGGPDDESNLQSLCIPCHDRKTREDLGQSEQFARDDDGWLIPHSIGDRVGRAGQK